RGAGGGERDGEWQDHHGDRPAVRSREHVRRALRLVRQPAGGGGRESLRLRLAERRGAEGGSVVSARRRDSSVPGYLSSATGGASSVPRWVSTARRRASSALRYLSSAARGPSSAP